MIRVWREPDGTFKITSFVPGVDLEAVARILLADGHVHPDATWEDGETAEIDAIKARLARSAG